MSDTTLMIAGYICIAVAVIWIVYKVYLSYMSFGGTVVVTVYDAAIFPPLLGTVGLYFVLPALGIKPAIWVYAIIVVVTVIVVAVAIRVAEELGDRRREF